MTLPALNLDVLARSPFNLIQGREACVAPRTQSLTPKLRNIDEDVTYGEDKILVSPKIPNANKQRNAHQTDMRMPKTRTYFDGRPIIV